VTIQSFFNFFLTSFTRAKESLMRTLPKELRDDTYAQLLEEDGVLKKLMLELRNTFPSL
jgi:hypothetical protein